MVFRVQDGLAINNQIVIDDNNNFYMANLVSTGDSISITGNITVSGSVISNGVDLSTVAGGLAATSIKTSAYTAAANELVRVDSSGGAFTVSLPAAPADGDQIGVVDVSASCGTYAVLIGANGKTVMGDSTGLSLNVNNAGATLVYDNATGDWDIVNATASGMTMSTNRILGRSTAGTGQAEELTVGSGLEISSGALKVTGNAVTSGLTMTSARILGRTTASNGAIEEISVSGATLSGGVLTISSSAPAWSIITADPGPAVAGSRYMANTTSAAFTITLPASPSANDSITISDYAGKFATNKLTIGRNGNKIMGGTVDVELTDNNITVTLEYIDATQGWRFV